MKSTYELYPSIKELRNIVALNKSPKVLVGQLSEIHVSLTGNPDDYAVEVASSAWFGSLAWPGVMGLVVGGPALQQVQLLVE